MKDFTLRMYRELCHAILENHQATTVFDFISSPRDCSAIIRHDVDKKPQNSLAMAKLEAELGIRSTYYFRTNPDVFDLSTIEKIHDLGHEIGYHYEVLDTARGDPVRAIQMFEQELKMFPNPIKTICMHGNPLSPWDNRDLWRQYDFRNYGVIGEAYLSIDFGNILYFSDTGRTWQNTYSVKDFTNSPTEQQSTAHSTMDLTRLCRNTRENICIVTHPQRWNDNFFPWITELVFQTVKNAGKAMIKKIYEGKRGHHESP